MESISELTKTIAFTLPVSCHICLGKVKQPAICSNLHVFCEICLKIWLERTPACPTCRIPINATNPYKTLLGGADCNGDIQGERWDLLRARIEISLREYEGELQKRKDRMSALESENKELLERLARKTSETSQNTGETCNFGNFTLVNDKLQEISTAYDKARKETSKLKQVNSKLTDTNVNLVRETERLKLEVCKRSPQKFSRITVATLQRKVDDSEKTTKQLQKALEKTDEYVLELEGKLKHCQCFGKKDYASSEQMKEMKDMKDFKAREDTSKKLSCQKNITALLDGAPSNKVDNPSISSKQFREKNPKFLPYSHGIKTYKSGMDSIDNCTQIAAMRVASCKLITGRSDLPSTLSPCKEVTESAFTFAKPTSSIEQRSSSPGCSESLSKVDTFTRVDSDRFKSSTITGNNTSSASSPRSSIQTSPNKRLRVTATVNLRKQ